MSLEPGQIIEGKYRIVRLIGEGGMGAVYEGENVRISRRVAIKVLHSGFTQNKEVTQRFEREAQAAGRIGNDHILEVIDLGSLSDGDHYIVMEYLDGEPLAARITHQKQLTPRELAPLVRQVLVGLAAAHRAGIVHRDLKPDNIFILRTKAGQTDFVKIIDFGISKFQPLGGDGMKMTRTGAVMGTPYYMSPEQASGSHDADLRSDLYSIGVIMFEAVTGQVPFEAATFNQLMFKIVLADVPRPEAIVPSLDLAFASIISKAMARDMTQRFQTAEDFLQAMDAWIASGTAVTVPPTADPAAAALIPANARSAVVSGQAGPGTAGSWATSKADEPVIPRSGPSLGVVIGAVAAVLVVGGGVAFALLGGKKAPEAEREPAPSAEIVPAAAPAAPLPAEGTATPTASVAAEEPHVVPGAAPSGSASAAVVAAPTPSDAKAAVRPVARPLSKSAPAGKAAPAANPAAKANGTPDFGY